MEMTDTEQMIYDYLVKKINPKRLRKNNIFLNYADRIIKSDKMQEKLPVFIDMGSVICKAKMNRDCELNEVIVVKNITITKERIMPYMYSFYEKYIEFMQYGEDMPEISWTDKDTFRRNIRNLVEMCVEDLELQDKLEEKDEKGFGYSVSGYYNEIETVTKEYMKLYDDKWIDCYVLEIDSKALYKR